MATYPVPAMDVFVVRCTQCRAAPGVACTSISDGAPNEKPHRDRYALAAEEARRRA